MPLYVQKPQIGLPRGPYVSSSNYLASLATDFFDPRDLSFRQLKYGQSPSSISSLITKENGSAGKLARFVTAGGGSFEGVRIGGNSDYTSTTQSWFLVIDSVKPASGNPACIINKFGVPSSGPGFGLHIDTSGIITLFSKNASFAQTTITDSKSYSGLTFIAFSISPSTMLMSINGSTCSGSTVSSYSLPTTQQLSLADSSDSYWTTFIGGVYAIFGWNGIALSLSQLHSLSVNPWQLFSSPVYYLPLSGAISPTIYEFQSLSRGVGRGIARGIA